MKRPTTPQIRARQVKLIKYQRATNKTDVQLAKEFGLTTKQIKNIKQRSPKQLRKVFSRSTGLQKVYQDVGPVSGKGSTKVRGTRILKAPFRPLALKRARIARIQGRLPLEEFERQVRTGIEIEELYIIPGDADATAQHEARLDWADWTLEHELPTSIAAINEMYDAGEIDDDTYNEAVEHWKETYGIE